MQPNVPQTNPDSVLVTRDLTEKGVISEFKTASKKLKKQSVKDQRLHCFIVSLTET
jgi:hypothetical protein